MGTTRVDSQAVHAAAQHFARAADVLNDVAHSQLGRISFDGSAAGKRHELSGDALNDVVMQFVSGTLQWSRAAAEVAAALRGAAISFTESEHHIAFGVQ